MSPCLLHLAVAREPSAVGRPHSPTPSVPGATVGPRAGARGHLTGRSQTRVPSAARSRPPVRSSRLATDDAYRRFPCVAALVVALHFTVLGVLTWAHRLPGFVPVVAAVASLAAYALYASDKRRARAGVRRVPESLLHAVEFLGGWPGALFAQWWLRHKNRKL